MSKPYALLSGVERLDKEEALRPTTMGLAQAITFLEEFMLAPDPLVTGRTFKVGDPRTTNIFRVKIERAT